MLDIYFMLLPLSVYVFYKQLRIDNDTSDHDNENIHFDFYGDRNKLDM